uniref:Uncharacterized protein n=1 Tax=Ascaris lumbricoides TaxID=6252 RepID=A0A0M3I8E4_ASCLU
MKGQSGQPKFRDEVSLDSLVFELFCVLSTHKSWIGSESRVTPNRGRGQVLDRAKYRVDLNLTGSNHGYGQVPDTARSHMGADKRDQISPGLTSRTRPDLE